MSKAFTTDSDEEGDILEAPALPAGTRNYMTPTGAARLRAEVDELTLERGNLPQNMEGKARTQVIDRRLRYLVPRVEALQVVNPLDQPKESVLFGATVTLSDGQGKPETWRIVGLDEMDLDRGWISWMSPLATALLEKRVGDSFSFNGRKLSVLRIAYEEAQ